MASSGHGGGVASPKEPQSAAHSHSSDRDADAQSPPPTPTASYPTQAAPGPVACPPLPPHVMYYPPAMGYPPGPPDQQYHHAYPQGYAGYTNGYPGGYQYPTVPYYGAPPTTYRARGGGIFRAFIVFSCVLLMFIFVSSFIAAMALRPQLPVYKVVSMSVANFSTAPVLAGDWVSGVTVENPNEKMRAHFSEFLVVVVYKDEVLAVDYAPGFELDKRGTRDMEVRASSPRANGTGLEKATLEQLGKERASGSVAFTLRISSVNTFVTGSISTRHVQVVGTCEGLKVAFQNNTGDGTLDNGGKPVECLIYV